MNKVYNTEIIAVGTELLLGHVTNTDARDISEMLSEIGINVLYHTVVGDNPGRLEECLNIARRRADIIITTGGQGPTCDDLTKQTVCRVFGMDLYLDENEFKWLYDYITARHPYSENNTQQAMLPVGCTVFHNSCGTAPGCAFEKDGKIVIMLPGPPKECRTMMAESVIPYLRRLSDEVIVSHTVCVFGMSESGVDAMFANEMNSMNNPSMAPYAKEASCLLKITAKAGSIEEAEEMCAPVIAYVREKLGDVVYGTDVENLEQAAAGLLLSCGKTVALAEGFTGGAVSARMNAALDNSPKTAGVPKPDNRDSVSNITEMLMKSCFIAPSAAADLELAADMADNIRISSGADIGAAVSGIEEGSFHIALSTGEATVVKTVEAGNFRPVSYYRQNAGNHVFDMIRRYLTGVNIL